MAELHEILFGVLKGILGTLVFFIFAVYYYIELLFKLIVPSSKKSLDGEIFLITGSSSGIGRQVVLLLAREHPRTTLVLWDINDQANKKVADEARKLGAKVFPYRVDVTNKENVEETAKKVANEAGAVTILFNNAGVIGLSDMLSMPAKDAEKSIDVNLTSHFWTLKAFLPSMIQNNYGHVVTTCSGAGFLGLRYDGPYCASKYGVRGYLESLKSEIRCHHKKDIKFTTVFPSFVKTPLIERVQYKLKFASFFKRLEPSHVAERIVEGVQRNDANVFVPRVMEIILRIKEVMPAKLLEKVEDFMVEEVTFTDAS